MQIGNLQAMAQFLSNASKSLSGTLADILSPARMIIFGTLLTTINKPMFAASGYVFATFGTVVCLYWVTFAKVFDRYADQFTYRMLLNSEVCTPISHLRSTLLTGVHNQHESCNLLQRSNKDHQSKWHQSSLLVLLVMQQCIYVSRTLLLHCEQPCI